MIRYPDAAGPLSILVLTAGIVFSGAAGAQDSTGAARAHAQGFNGSGQVIAILDRGFRTTHRELNGKITQMFDSFEPADHGTHVASIAAGAYDQFGIDGVAWGARLHLATVFDREGRGGPSRWAQATRSAAASGAVVQNNSWNFDGGFPVSDAIAMSVTSGLDAAETLARLGREDKAIPVIGSVREWRDYLAAMRDFQRGGVIVRTLANDKRGGLRARRGTSLSAALPELDARLRGRWIAVGNVDIREADGKRIVSLNSAPCAEAAEYCLVADGTGIRGASASGDTRYASATGTSFAAPQISGALAILAQAFPYLPPDALVARLLSTADNSFFSPDGYTDFGGVRHGWSRRYGHGIADLARALAGSPD